MKIRISCPAASMTADLTEEQVSAVFEQVKEWAFTHKESFKEESNEDVYDSPDYSPDEDNEPSLLEVLSRDITDESTFTPPLAPKPEIKAFSSLGEVNPKPYIDYPQTTKDTKVSCTSDVKSAEEDKVSSRNSRPVIITVNSAALTHRLKTSKRLNSNARIARTPYST